MSQYVYETPSFIVRLGYDRPLDYVFCTIEQNCCDDCDNTDLVYSNLADENAGTEQQDIEYFKPILAKFGIELPQECFDVVKFDQNNARNNQDVSRWLRSIELLGDEQT